MLRNQKSDLSAGQIASYITRYPDRLRDPLERVRAMRPQEDKIAV